MPHQKSDMQKMNNNEKTNDWMHSRKHFPWGTPFIRRSVFIGNKKSFIHRISHSDIAAMAYYGHDRGHETRPPY